MKLHSYFYDGTIIQSNKHFTVKGTTRQSTCVRADLILNGKTVTSACSITDENGCFEIEMLPRTASFDAYVMRVFTPFDEITVNDLLFGDVYFLTGQSNMQYEFCHQKDNLKTFNNYHKIR